MTQDPDTATTDTPQPGSTAGGTVAVAAPGPRLLSEADMELIDGLQLNPRASWAELGSALGVDPVTVARRWQRMSEAGEAWATAALGHRQLHTMSVAVIEIDCEGGAAADVAATLAPLRHLVTVQHVAGSYDLWALAVTANLSAMADLLLSGLPQIPGVRKVRTHMATRVFDASRRWRLRVLPTSAARRLRPEPPAVTSSRPMDTLDRRLFTQLSVDGRASFESLAEPLGTSARTVKRRLDRLVAVGDVDFRCDLARQLAGWQASAVLWLQAPDDTLEATGRALLDWPQTRTCAALAGPHNMLLTVGLHSVADLHPLVTQLRQGFPHVRVADRQLVLRQTKLYGRVLDTNSRWVSATPVDPWSVGHHGSQIS